MKNFTLSFIIFFSALCYNAQAQFFTCPTIGHYSTPNSMAPDSFWVDNFNGNTNTTYFEWRFCDGSTEYGMNITHPMYNSGVMLTNCEVCLTVIDSATSNVLCVACDTFNATGNPPNNNCAAYASYTNVDSLYTFFVTTTGGNPVAYDWTVNGNSVGTTDSVTVVITGSGMVNGAYVCVEVTDTSGCVASDCIVIGSNGNPGGGGSTPCQAYFVIYGPDSTNGGINTPGGGLPGHYWGYNLSSGNYGNDILWDFGDGSTSTDPYPVHVYANPGNYIVCLTVGVQGTSCYDTYCDSSFYAFKTENNPMVQLNIVSATGVEEIKESSLSVFPNPATNELNWAMDNRIEQVRIFDVPGQKIMDARALSNKLSVSKLTTGIYFLQLTDKTGKVLAAQRFVKQ